MNPFGHKKDAVTKTDLRSARIIHGGTCLEDRRIRLVLLQPSYQKAIHIARCINDRYGSSEQKVADPLSPTEIRLTIPESHQEETFHHK